MNPRIFINIHYLEIGGAETSLIGLLQALGPKRVEVDLFLNDHRGEMMAYISNWVNVLPPCKAYTMIERPIKEVIKAGYIHIALARLWVKIRFELYARKKQPIDGSAIFGYVGKYVTPLLPSLKRLGKYDLAISFVTPHNIVLDKVQAKKKICWIHTDYTNIDVNTDLELAVWSGYDHIVSISKDVTLNFCQVFPSLGNKIIEIENILSPRFIRQQADLEAQPLDMPKVGNGYTLLTIGRYSYQKKQEEIPIICRMLIEKGLTIKWYIIGYGGSDEYIRKAIKEEGMEENVILLGKRTNPYPYIKLCDWYVQPSRYEGKSVVVREAQI
ncbi:MAG: glycosyltransferase, partial [Erysipelotrichales bacterium]|nr:glycosyltransferase [Erysipelotrichales bacterium]